MGNIHFDKWSAALLNNCGHYFGVPVSKKEPLGHFKIHHWFGLDVMDIASNVELIKRTKQDTKRDDIENIYLLKQISGSLVTKHNDKTSMLEPGDFFLLDSTQCAELIFQGQASHFLSVHMPRAEFLDCCQTGIEIGKVCKASSLKGKALSAAFPEKDTSLVEAMAEPGFLFDLARIAFLKDKNNTSLLRHSCRKNRYAAILQIISHNLTNPEISLEWLANAAKMSTRQLQRDFYDNDTTFSSVLTERRLMLVIEKLRRAIQTGHTPNIAHIAFDSGFGDISNFNRMFKRQLDCSPSDYLRQIKLELP